MSLPKHIKDLIEDGDRLFTKRRDLMNLWQEIALHFYPEMADFTTVRSIGDEFADHLATSYPLIARRSLGDAFSSLLRPAALDSVSPGVWFSMRLDRDEYEDQAAKEFLDWATGVMRRAMYDRKALFTRATKQADHVFATFGNAPMSVATNRDHNGLIYQTWHLRDIAWSEGADGLINHVQRKWKPTATESADLFRERLAPKVKEKLTTYPHDEVEYRHIVIAAEKYVERDRNNRRFREPYVSIWVDVSNDHVVSEVGSWSPKYVIPTWMAPPGCQYGASPAVTAALPDARLIQAMCLTVLDAAERFADPPIITKAEIFKNGMDLFPGGVSTADIEHDQNIRDQIMPLYDGKSAQGLGAAMEMKAQTEAAISKAFFLDSLSLPPSDARDMTAFEVGQRISEWIRRAMPIIEPIEFDYNGALCEATFDIMMRAGAFGAIADMPPNVRGQDIKFKFESPLHENQDRRKGQKLLEAKALMIEMAELNPSAIHMLKPIEALRDVLTGIGVPADWQPDERELEAAVQAAQRQQAETAALGQLGAGSEAAANLGTAAKDFATARTTGV